MAWTRGDISADLIPKFSFLGRPCWQKKHWQQQPPWLYEVSCAGKKLQLSGILVQIFKQPAAPEKFENSLSEGKLGCSSLWDQQVVKSHPFTSDTGREVLSVLQHSQIFVFALVFLMQVKSHGLAFSTGMRCLSIFVGCDQSEFWASQNHRWLRTPSPKIQYMEKTEPRLTGHGHQREPSSCQEVFMVFMASQHSSRLKN